MYSIMARKKLWKSKTNKDSVSAIENEEEKWKHSKPHSGEGVTKANTEDTERNETYRQLWKGDLAQTTKVEHLMCTCACAYVWIENIKVCPFCWILVYDKDERLSGNVSSQAFIAIEK